MRRHGGDKFKTGFCPSFFVFSYFTGMPPLWGCAFFGAGDIKLPVFLCLPIDFLPGGGYNKFTTHVENKRREKK